MQEELHQAFGQASSELIRSLASLSEEELNRVPFEGSWTAGQLGDHLLKSYGVADILSGQTTATERPVDEKIGPIKEAFLNFDIKMESPDFIIPSDGYINKGPLLSGLRERTGQVLQFIEADYDLSRTCLDFELPGTGHLTRQEWIQFMTVHTQRHVHQLKNMIKNLTQA